MNPPFEFTFHQLNVYYRAALDRGYRVVPCRDYIDWKAGDRGGKVLVNRVDVDYSPKNARRVASIFNRLNIKGTFFIRLHAPEYNPFSFENYRIFRFIKDSGHEIGYHSEVIDQAVIWKEDAETCLHRDIDILNRMLGIHVVGVASHGGLTGLNNLDFWKDRTPEDFGLHYEAYDTRPRFNLFHESLYISDSDWAQWKCYRDGKPVKDDRRTPTEHFRDNHPVVYLLTHPSKYYDEHLYE